MVVCIVGIFGVVDCNWLDDDANRIRPYFFTYIELREKISLNLVSVII